MSSFDDKLSLLASCELPHARRDPQRLADMIGGLTDALALTIAIAAEGDRERMSELLEGISVQLFEGAASKAPMAKFIAGASR